MAEQSIDRLQAASYRPTSAEIELLNAEGLTLEQALQYDQPTAAEYVRLQTLGCGLIETILKTAHLHKNMCDALNQFHAFFSSDYPQDEIDQDIAEAQAHAIKIITLRLLGNPYPGKGFSKEQGFVVLEEIKKERWNKDNLRDCLERARRLL